MTSEIPSSGVLATHLDREIALALALVDTLQREQTHLVCSEAEALARVVAEKQALAEALSRASAAREAAVAALVAERTPLHAPVVSLTHALLLLTAEERVPVVARRDHLRSLLEAIRELNGVSANVATQRLEGVRRTLSTGGATTGRGRDAQAYERIGQRGRATALGLRVVGTEGVR